MKSVAPNIHCNNIDAFTSIFSKKETAAEISSNVRLGIIFEGGALRGVLSCGYGRALTERISAEQLYALYGSSSGALNSVYFLSNQLETAHSIYVENATDKRCTNIRNFPNVLDVDWLLDNWIFGSKQFNWSKIKRSHTRLFISLTRIIDGTPKYVDATIIDLATLNKAMKATSYAPLLTNSTQLIDGDECGDGAIADAIPFQRAINDGCTHIICLLTRPKNYRKGQGNFISRWFKRVRLSRHTREYKNAYWEGEHKYNELLTHLYSGTMSVPTMIIAPAKNSELPHNIETNPSVINKLGLQAYYFAKSQLEKTFPETKP